jgi:hypothetical protein
MRTAQGVGHDDVDHRDLSKITWCSGTFAKKARLLWRDLAFSVDTLEWSVGLGKSAPRWT